MMMMTMTMTVIICDLDRSEFDKSYFMGLTSCLLSRNSALQQLIPPQPLPAEPLLSLAGADGWWMVSCSSSFTAVTA